MQIGLRHPFFRAPWRRAATTAVAGGWCLIEVAGGHYGWAVPFGVMALLCIWEFYVVFDPKNYEEPDD